MKKILTIAKHTFREAARDRVLYGLLAFATVFIFLDLFFARLALGDPVMIKSFGLAGIYVFGLIITVFLGASIIQKEIERRTLYFILSKPVSRVQLVLGKFFGLLGAILLTVALMAAIYLAVVALEGGGFDALGLQAILFQMFEMALLTALMVFFSSVVRPLTATICSMLLLFTGHLLPSVVQNAKALGSSAHSLILSLYYILPNLAKFDVRELAAHGIAMSPQAMLFAALYAVAYSAILLILAVECFKRREL
jgi:ABC-type transport system involved in multi-copper enzyme maturation permease subunit